MSTKAKYFPHFTSTLLDDKISNLRRKLGEDALSGYAIYFILLEKLANKTNYELEYNDEFLDDLAFELRCESALIKRVIEDFNLFVVDDKIYSPALKENMKYFENKKQKSSNGGKQSSANMTAEQRSERASKASNKRWNKESNNGAEPDSMLSDLASNANELESDANNRNRNRNTNKDKNRDKDKNPSFYSSSENSVTDFEELSMSQENENNSTNTQNDNNEFYSLSNYDEYFNYFKNAYTQHIQKDKELNHILQDDKSYSQILDKAIKRYKNGSYDVYPFPDRSGFRLFDTYYFQREVNNHLYPPKNSNNSFKMIIAE